MGACGASWSCCVSRPRRGRGGGSLKGGSSSDIAGPWGPRRLDPLHRHRLSCMVTIPGSGLGPGSGRIALFLINTMFWSGTCFASVSAARLAGRRLWLKESVKKSLSQKNERSYPHEDMDNSAPDWGSSRGDLKNCTFWFENPAPGKVRSVRGVRSRAFRGRWGDDQEFFTLRA